MFGPILSVTLQDDTADLLSGGVDVGPVAEMVAAREVSSICSQ